MYIKFTEHRDGTVSVRMDRDTFSNLEAATVYADMHWRKIVADKQSEFPSIDRQICFEHIELAGMFTEFLRKLRGWAEAGLGEPR